MDSLSNSPTREACPTWNAPQNVTCTKTNNLIAPRRNSAPRIFTFDPSSIPQSSRRRSSMPHLQNRPPERVFTPIQNPLRRSKGIIDLALALQESKEKKQS